MAKRVFESDRPQSERVSLAIILYFPKSERPRDTKRREDKGELRPRNLLSALLRECEGFAIFS